MLAQTGPLPPTPATGPAPQDVKKTTPDAAPSRMTLTPKSASELAPPPPTAAAVYDALPERTPPKTGPPTKARTSSGKPVRHLVQIASYKDRRSATRLQQRLEVLGMPSLRHVVRSRGQRLQRISAGPFPSLEDAELAQRIIEQELSISGTRLQSLPDLPEKKPVQAAARQRPTPKAAPTAVPAPATAQTSASSPARPRNRFPGSTYSIQLASFSNHSGAGQLRKRLRHMGLPSYQYPITVQARTFIRVNVGPFITRNDANIADCVIRDKLRMAGKLDADKRLNRQPPRPARPLLSRPKGNKRGVQLHLASFSDRQRAHTVRQHLLRIGLQPLLSRVERDGKRFVRIDAGPFLNRAQAEMAACLIKERFQLNPTLKAVQ